MGFGVDAVTASLTATGAWSQMVRYSLLSIGLLTLTFGSAHEIQWAGLSVLVAAVVAGGTVLFVRVVQSERVARAVGGFADRVVGWVARRVHRAGPDLTAWVLSLREQLADVLANRRGRMTLATLAGELSAVLVLVAALRLMGIDSDEVGWPLAIVAYGAMSFASMVLPTPGGVGVAEASVFAVLGPAVATSQDDSLAAAIALYRMATWLLPTLLGIPAYLVWRYRRSWREPDPAATS